MMQNSLGMAWSFETSNPTPVDICPPTRLHLLFHPKQFLQLGTKYSNIFIWMCVSVCLCMYIPTEDQAFKYIHIYSHSKHHGVLRFFLVYCLKRFFVKPIYLDRLLFVVEFWKFFIYSKYNFIDIYVIHNCFPKSFIELLLCPCQ